jgi:hypothetical protein
VRGHLGIVWKVRRITPILRRVGTYGLYPLLAAIAPRGVRERFARDRQREIAEKTGETPFLAGLEAGRADDEIASAAGVDAAVVERVRLMRERSEVMRRGTIRLER